LSDPERIYRRSDLTPAGQLTVEAVDRIHEVLMDRGAVMLPSDTAYSFAMVPLGVEIRQTVNAVLGRPDIPISLAFPSVRVAREWIGPNRVANALLQKYCPGPITVVTSARGSERAKRAARSLNGAITDRFFDVIAVQDWTIGVRIPDSIIEREVADATTYPINTTPVLDERGNPVLDFDRAMAIVGAGIDRLRKVARPEWIAIEGDRFRESRSTVVRVNDRGRLKEIRDEHIPFAEIKAFVAALAPPLSGGSGG
jgi:L-threonylcarbamoyladenylate synthase